jgi:DNA-binding Lrp family transcriptional regulator
MPSDSAFTEERIHARIREIAERLHVSRPELLGRLRRFVRVAEILLKPHRDARPLAIALGSYTEAEFYGALWLLLILDVYRDDPEGARFATEVVQLTKEEWEDVLRLTLLISEKYFGVPTPVE